MFMRIKQDTNVREVNKLKITIHMWNNNYNNIEIMGKSSPLMKLKINEFESVFCLLY